jgi:hypothetical protein
MKLLLVLLSVALSAQAQLRPGETELTFPNGGIYQGTVKDGLPDGFGYVHYPSGDQYEGAFKAGMREGHCIASNPIGDVYDGQWKNGKRNGMGKLTYRMGGSYEGEWQNDRFHGKGVMTFVGTGLRREARYIEGVEEGAAADLSKEQHVTSYRLVDDSPEKGRSQVAYGFSYPLDKKYGEMNDKEKSGIRARYGAALATGDEPPFPINGMKPIVTQLAQAGARSQQVGNLEFIVNVAANGAPVSVTMFKSTSEKMTKFLNAMFMQQRFKPAVCGGVACPMAFYYATNLTKAE